MDSNIIEDSNNTEIELSEQQREIDSLLKREDILEELRSTLIASNLSRSYLARDDDYKDPVFEHVKEFHNAVYTEDKKIHEGAWNENHRTIASKNSVEKEPGENPVWQQRKCISGLSFTLTGAQNIKILRIDTLHKFTVEDLEAIEKAGYLLVDPEYKWVIRSNKTKEGYTTVNSAIPF